MKKKIISFSAIVPFILPLIVLFLLVGLPLLTFGVLREDLTEAVKLGSILILIPYSFLVLAILQQTRLAHVDVIEDDILVYRDSPFKKEQRIKIEKIARVKMQMQYDANFETDETITLFDSEGKEIMVMDVEKLSGEIILEILSTIKERNSKVEFDKVSSDFLQGFKEKFR